MADHQFYGIHIFGEFYDIDPKVLNDYFLIENALLRGVNQCGAHICDSTRKFFDPQGFTVLLLLEESHVSIHTYPEQQALFFDAFTCGTTCKPEVIAEALHAALNPGSYDLRAIQRGKDSVAMPLIINSNLLIK